MITQYELHEMVLLALIDQSHVAVDQSQLAEMVQEIIESRARISSLERQLSDAKGQLVHEVTYLTGRLAAALPACGVAGLFLTRCKQTTTGYGYFQSHDAQEHGLLEGSAADGWRITPAGEQILKNWGPK